MRKNENRYKSALQFLWKVIKPHQKWFILAAGITLITVGSGLMLAKTTQLLIDYTSSGNKWMILISLLKFILLIIANLVLSYISGICVSRLAAFAGKDLKQHASHLLLNAEYGEMIQLETGDTLKTVNSDIGTVCSFIGGDLISIFSQFSMAIGAFIYLLFINPILALVTFIYTPIGIFFTLSLNKKMNKLYPICADSEGRALSVAEQILSSIPIVKSFSAEKLIKEKVRHEYEKVYQADVKVSIWNSLMQTACSSTSMIPRITYLFFAGYMVVEGNLSIGTFISVFDLLTFIIGPTVYFPFLLNGLNYSIASINRIVKMEKLHQQKPVKQISDYTNTLPSVRLNNVSFSYMDNAPIISNISFEHTGPGIVAVCGKSGSGKTTLLDLLSGLYEPQTGEIVVSGAISVVSQDSYLFADTLLNNVRLSNPLASDKEVENAMKLAGADVFVSELSAGFDTLVGDGNADFSGGQKQRISLARTILSDSKIWLLDEPTSALDIETESVILETIKKVSKDKLIIIAAHRQTLIDIAERKIEL
ncbi:ABC transporter ATP-binding protein [Paenibacillus sp. IHBB 10380]|uniref:ABC transporter ATP-binding protein n=1 Tax=Paenibacillus sp. IHBB 10380 TaxID=1566358 RepID=UPI0005CF9696|nr:ABC transporter ATP-binding protein [Paenibacillus sp. IHBB 10380]AJS57212.1 hypothetical protein UB51_00375 [Paenibacillus sp. IHBB 10380]